MDVVRGSLREFGQLLSLMIGGTDEGDDRRPQPRRDVVWISVQVLALALTLAALFAVGGLLFEPAVPGTVATGAAWFLPAFWLALPLAIHWFAGPPRRTPGLLLGLLQGLLMGGGFSSVVDGLPAPWAGLLTCTVAACAAAVVYGLISPIPARP